MNDRFPHDQWVHRIHVNAGNRAATVGAALELAGIAAAATAAANEAQAQHDAVNKTVALLRQDLATAAAAAAPRMVIDAEHAELRDAFIRVAALVDGRHHVAAGGACAGDCAACVVLAAVPDTIWSAYTARIDDPISHYAGDLK